MKELKPDTLEDIIAGVSLYRPGPMDQIPRYIRNKLNPEHSEYTHPALEPILNVTYGCMVYQEQVMQIVRDLAGYSLGRADLVRRAMGKKKLDVMAKERENFIYGQTDENGKVIIPGCIRNGIDEASANKIFDEMAEFAKYAFNKSHAAAYAVVAYRTAYLKTYYPVEFMAATLNSFLGNLDKIPEYIAECKRTNIEILKPSINQSYTKFAVYGNQIRFGLGSIKNVGTSAVEYIVAERKKNGEYKSFTDFCERVQVETINKKCIESLIKAGAFDELGETRHTLLENFEAILDTISNASKRSLQGQVTMFDMQLEEDVDKHKYNINQKPEYDERTLLDMEKEMLGIYISGHPLDKLTEKIKKVSNIDTIQAMTMKEENNLSKDGQQVKYVGIITSLKKKYTKNNTLMVFATIEDLYGSMEIIIFENCYKKSSNALLEDNIVLVEGRLSIREDEDVKIVANNIINFSDISENSLTEQNKSSDNKNKILTLSIIEATEEQKNKLRGAIKFFAGDRNNMRVQVLDTDGTKPCGAIYLTDDIYKEFEEILGRENVSFS